MYRVGEDLDDLSVSRGPDTPRRPESRNVSRNTSFLQEEKTCRICFEGPSRQRPLINPCRCAGSVKFIHEECLKTWLLSQQIELEDSACEICKVKFQMKFIVASTCDPAKACKTGFTHCITLPLLIVVFSMLLLIIYILAAQIPSESSSSEGYTIALIVVCFLSSGVVLLLIVNSFRDMLCVKKMTQWVIKSQDFTEEPANPTESPIKDEASMRVAEVTTHNFEQARSPEMSRGSQASGIIVVPEVTRVRGQRVRTPTVSPSLQAVQSANPRLQAFLFNASQPPSGYSTPLQPYIPKTPPLQSARSKKNSASPEQQSFRDEDSFDT